ncbi:uncharacterized protein LOC101847469 [Aplysia californica]|uniref:Uncharacterized protein LOC101847469 n=1 Tax=Aplysia californica TaxID=6500 RepID=A0ABM0JD26_APLCA|nr:uncharacterized protein LOC101847469 [Aplysia californica]
MDAYNFYLSTFRYIMNADSSDKSTWCELFKYLPCLRQMLSCCVCGSIMLRPQGPTHGVCLHHVCLACVGGRMRLKPSCSWCKDHGHFVENKKLRVLILCFKKLCAYVSSSPLGAEISKTSVNGCGVEAECTLKILEEAERFCDDYVLTPPPKELPTVSKSSCGGVKISSEFQAVSSDYNSKVNTFQNGKSSSSTSGANVGVVQMKRGRGRPRTAAGRFSLRTPKSCNSLRARVNKLKKKALTPKIKNLPNKRNFVKTTRPYNKRLPPDTTDFLIAHRPHRDRSGKFSVGQLWRETFLDEVQPDTYPDSGIEVGSCSDQDHNSNLSPVSKLTVDKSVSSTGNLKVEVARKETRHHKLQENDSRPELSVNDVTSSTDEPGKPRLTLTISKKRYQKYNNKGSHAIKLPGKKTDGNECEILTPDVTTIVPNFKRAGLKTKTNHCPPKMPKAKTCRCARFKKPNHLTCFGQKCPCYSEKRGCTNCMCNGCKNPLQSGDFAPPLMHILRDSDNLDSSFDRSMPRLSPIPKL